MAYRVPCSTYIMLINEKMITIYPDEARSLVMNLNYSPIELMNILDKSNENIKEFDECILDEENN